MQGNLRPNVTRDCLALARSKGATTALNPSPTFAAHDYDWTLVDLSWSTAARRSNSPACSRGGGARALQEGRRRGRSYPWRGRRRFLLGRRTFRVAAPQVIAVDTVGAGDVFCGVLIAAKLSGATGEMRSPPPPRPLRFGRANGCLCFLSVAGRDGGYSSTRGGRTPRGELLMTEGHSVARARGNALKSYSAARPAC